MADSLYAVSIILMKCSCRYPGEFYMRRDAGMGERPGLCISLHESVEIIH
jgi:hypothetical protein